MIIELGQVNPYIHLPYLREPEHTEDSVRVIYRQDLHATERLVKGGTLVALFFMTLGSISLSAQLRKTWQDVVRGYHIISVEDKNEESIYNIAALRSRIVVKDKIPLLDRLVTVLFMTLFFALTLGAVSLLPLFRASWVEAVVGHGWKEEFHLLEEKPLVLPEGTVVEEQGSPQIQPLPVSHRTAVPSLPAPQTSPWCSLAQALKRVIDDLKQEMPAPGEDFLYVIFETDQKTYHLDKDYTATSLRRLLKNKSVLDNLGITLICVREEREQKHAIKAIYKLNKQTSGFEREGSFVKHESLDSVTSHKEIISYLIKRKSPF